MITKLTNWALLSLILLLVFTFQSVHTKDISKAHEPAKEKVSTCYVNEKRSNETKPCVIPFIFRDRIFKGCTDFIDPNSPPWCSTEVDDNGHHIKGIGTWGECKDACVMDNKGKLINVNATCNSDEFKCSDGHNCVSMTVTCDDVKDCDDGSDELNCKTPPEIDCGVPDYLETCNLMKIIGGTSSCVSQFPWLVSIRVYDDEFHSCGGALINKDWVVTAAHCVFQDGVLRAPEFFYLWMGATDFADEKPVKRRVTSVQVHPYWNKTSFDNDLALLRLDEKVTFSSTLMPICLTDEDSYIDGNSDKGIAAGWGKTNPFGGEKTTEMKFVSVPILSNKQCEEMFLGRFYFRNITENFMCAGFVKGGSDTCQGDSGGPLMVKKAGRFELAGVTSWGLSCAGPNSPGVYTRMSKFAKWIKNLVASLN